MKKHRIIGLVLFALGLGFSILMLQEPQQDEVALQRTGIGHTIDYYLDDLQVTSMGADGRPERMLRADKLRHYVDDNATNTDEEATEMDNPYLIIDNRERGRWEISAEQGWLSADGELVLLTGTVDIQRQAKANVRPMHLLTSKLRVLPEQHYAETDAEVFITSGDNKINATGMQAWLKHPTKIKLLSKTRGHYVFN